MTIDYIAGFLDGEGSVTLCRERKDAKFRMPMVTFSNNARCILEDIHKYLNLSGSLIQKTESRPNCKPSFTLNYRDNAALAVCRLLQDRVRHPSKKARMELLLTTYKLVTPRNGKYSTEILKRKLEFEKRFAEM
jgi:hypothetical protein